LGIGVDAGEEELPGILGHELLQRVRQFRARLGSPGVQIHDDRHVVRLLDEGVEGGRRRLNDEPVRSGLLGGARLRSRAQVTGATDVDSRFGGGHCLNSPYSSGRFTLLRTRSAPRTSILSSLSSAGT